jgi:hypothetical protein
MAKPTSSLSDVCATAIAEGKLMWHPFLAQTLALLGFPSVEYRNPLEATDSRRGIHVVFEFGFRRRSLHAASDFDSIFRSYLQFCRCRAI